MMKLSSSESESADLVDHLFMFHCRGDPIIKKMLLIDVALPHFVPSQD